MTRYALNLPNELKRDAERLAKKQGVSLNQFILWSVAEKVGGLLQGLDDPNFPNITYRQAHLALSQPFYAGQGFGCKPSSCPLRTILLPNSQKIMI